MQGKKRPHRARLALVLGALLHMCVPVGMQPAPSLSLTVVSPQVAASHPQVGEGEAGRAIGWVPPTHPSRVGR